MINEEEISDKMNPILEIQQRNQEEIDIVLQMIKGLFFLLFSTCAEIVHFVFICPCLFLTSRYLVELFRKV